MRGNQELIDDAAAKQGRLVSLPDADCLHRDVILFCVPRGRDRVDAGHPSDTSHSIPLAL